MSAYRLAIVFLLIGLTLLGAGVAVGFADLRLMLAGETIEAMIVSFEEAGPEVEGELVPRRVRVRYEPIPQGGRYLEGEVKVEDPSQWLQITNKEIETLAIRVDPEEPTRIAPRGQISPPVIISAVMSGVGFVFVLIGTLVIAGARYPRFGENIGMIVGGGVAFMTLLGLYIAAGFLLYDDYVKENVWQRTQAEIIAAEVVAKSRRDSNSTRFYDVYIPRVAYRFKVNGRSYLGKGPSDVTSYSTDRAWAERIVAGYSVGQSVPVHYDPQTPARSALEIQAGILGYIFLGAALAFTLIPWVVVRFFFDRQLLDHVQTSRFHDEVGI